MSEAKRESVTIAGSGKISGGVYDVVKVTGSGVIQGDIEANTIKTAGSCRIHGDVKVLQMKTAGSCQVKGDVEAGEFKTAGSCKVSGEVKATQFGCSGSQQIGANLTAGEVQITGSCEVEGNVEADRFFSRGRFKIDGLLTADEIKVELASSGPCRAGEIGGERIEVRSHGPFWEWRGEEFERKMGKVGYKLEKSLSKLRDRFGIQIEIGDIDKLVEEIARLGEKIRINLGDFQWGGAARLEVETIEGDEIYLENTKAAVVRGGVVTVGRGCRIERVEYRESLEVDEEATVHRQEKI